MALGFDSERKVVSSGDSADIYAYLYDDSDAPLTANDIVSVAFTIQAPDGSRETLNGQVQSDGAGFLRYLDTSQIGHYSTQARFTLSEGQIRSTRADFEIIDPFNPPAPSELETLAHYAWTRLEDCFDAEEEGPWLRDVTLNYFSESKVANFTNDAMFDLNERNPETALSLDYFFLNGQPTADLPLLSQGVSLQVIRHLMRSYVEQPLPQGASVVYEDRRDYLQRWGTIYQIEKDFYDRELAFFKRRFLGLGKSSLLVDTKAGRLLPAPLRVRTTGRGYY